MMIDVIMKKNALKNTFVFDCVWETSSGRMFAKEIDAQMLNVAML